jgi:hypothetical protein
VVKGLSEVVLVTIYMVAIPLNGAVLDFPLDSRKEIVVFLGRSEQVIIVEYAQSQDIVASNGDRARREGVGFTEQISKKHNGKNAGEFASLGISQGDITWGNIDTNDASETRGALKDIGPN